MFFLSKTLPKQTSNLVICFYVGISCTPTRIARIQFLVKTKIIMYKHSGKTFASLEFVKKIFFFAINNCTSTSGKLFKTFIIYAKQLFPHRHCWVIRERCISMSLFLVDAYNFNKATPAKMFSYVFCEIKSTILVENLVTAAPEPYCQPKLLLSVENL